MGHGYWGMHMIWGLNATLRYVSSMGVDFSLGRAYRRGDTCRGVAPMCATPGACAASDVISRPWQSPIVREPFPPSSVVSEYKYGADQTAGSCSVGYFTCEARSKMCNEEKMTWEPMDGTQAREMWIDCTNRLCERLGIARYAPECAAAMLATWASIWRNWPDASNATLAKELSDAGSTANSAVGWHEPRHAVAALTSLSHQAVDMLSSSKAVRPGGGSGASGLAGTPYGKAIMSCPALVALHNATLARRNASSSAHQPHAGRFAKGGGGGMRNATDGGLSTKLERRGAAGH
jgi:hypothetical protein